MDIKSILNTLKKSELFGDPRYGKEFDDIDLFSEKGFSNPQSIIIRKGDIIDNLTFVYNGYTAAHGGSGGSKKEAILGKDEYVVKVAGTYRKYGNEVLIETLAFTTNKGNVISAGQPIPGKDYFEYKVEEGYSICALFGRADRFLNCIGFHSKKIDMDTKDGILNSFRR